MDIRAMLEQVRAGEMPIAQAVVQLLDGRINAAQAVDELMGRQPAREGR